MSLVIQLRDIQKSYFMASQAIPVLKGIDLDIKEDFAFLFVGHWLKGDLGQDRKDVGMLIKCFATAFSNSENKPALVLKTSSATFSVKERENFRKRIEDLVKDIKNPPSIYLLFGDLTNEEMNNLYNHPFWSIINSLLRIFHCFNNLQSF